MTLTLNFNYNDVNAWLNNWLVANNLISKQKACWTVDVCWWGYDLHSQLIPIPQVGEGGRPAHDEAIRSGGYEAQHRRPRLPQKDTRFPQDSIDLTNRESDSDH